MWKWLEVSAARRLFFIPVGVIVFFLLCCWRVLFLAYRGRISLKVIVSENGLAGTFARIFVMNASTAYQSIIVLEKIILDNRFHHTSLGFVEDPGTVGSNIRFEKTMGDLRAAISIYADIHDGPAVEVGLIVDERTMCDDWLAGALFRSQVQNAGAFASVIFGDCAVADNRAAG